MSRIGAQTPIVLEVGKSPIKNVATPILAADPIHAHHPRTRTYAYHAAPPLSQSTFPYKKIKGGASAGQT